MEGWLWRGWHLQGSRQEARSSEGPFTLQLGPGRSEEAGPEEALRLTRGEQSGQGSALPQGEIGGRTPSRQLFTVMLVCLHVLTHLSCGDII